MYQRVDMILLKPVGEARPIPTSRIEEIKSRYLALAIDKDWFEGMFNRFVESKCRGIGPRDIGDKIDSHLAVKAYNDLVREFYTKHEIDAPRKISVRVPLEEKVAENLERIVLNGLEKVNSNGPEDYEKALEVFLRASESAIMMRRNVWVVDLIDEFRSELEGRGISPEDLKNYYVKTRERTR